jgi:beta-glucosidase
MGWEVAPRSLRDLLLRLKRDYQLPPIYITENGAAYRDQLVDGQVEDEQRRQYIESHLVAVAEAIDRGVDVRGYFVWSLMDNFEWAEGYRKRFGIVHVDYATLRRTLKRSALWYRSLLQIDRSVGV